MRNGEEIVPSVRSRVYEYGGRAYTVHDGEVTFEADGPTGDHFRDFRVEERGEEAFITRGGSVVVAGRDFFAAPRVADDGRLAYLAWDHPHMPWDAAELWVDERQVAGGDGVSCLQPGWLRDGSLVWIDDRTGWWNLYRDGEPVAPMEAEVGYPAWLLGFQNWCELADGRLAFTAHRDGFDHLTIDGEPVDTPFTELQWLVPYRDGLACIAGGHDHAPSVVAIAPDGSFEVVRAALDIELDEVSRPEHISFGAAHALFYPPTRQKGQTLLSPVIVLSHGGPTAQAESSLDLGIQFWTSRGFAVADVNYRGSTGYGTAFRNALRGQWGIADVEDCVACVQHLAAEGKVDGDRAIIRGSSAGGYTSLQALTTTDAFAAGSSWYGVADASALARDTHKFEARYLDQLIGPWPQAEATYRERSAIHHLDGFSAPVILFQGLDDKVVPPAQAREMAAALEAKGLDHELHLYEGEGHGFRRAETREVVLEAEHRFITRAIGFPAS